MEKKKYMAYVEYTLNKKNGTRFVINISILISWLSVMEHQALRYVGEPINRG